MHKITKISRKLLETNLRKNVSVLYSSSKDSEEKSQSIIKYDQKNVSKADMQWRTPWHEKEGQYYTMLRSFYSSDNQIEVTKWLQTEFSARALKKWWLERKEKHAIHMQSYLEERNQMLGNELAAAHFIVFRGGAVKFHGTDEWIKADRNNNYTLPRRLDLSKFLQAIDCSNMELFYEGLVNLRSLRKVEWLNLTNCERVDDWFLDRITNIFSHSLIYLDLRECPNYSHRGLGALYKIPSLKILYVDDRTLDPRFEMTCLLLQEHNPHLDIRME